MNRRKAAIWFLRPFFRWFDRVFFRARDRYLRLVGHSLSKKLRYVVVFLLIVAAMGFLFQRMPTAYLPDEDQGMLMVQAMLPANSTLEQTKKVMDGVRDHFLEHEKDAVEACHDDFRRRASPAGDRTRAWPLSSSRTGTSATGRT